MVVQNNQFQAMEFLITLRQDAIFFCGNRIR